MSGQGYVPTLGNAATVLPSNATFIAFSVLAGETVQLQWPVDNYPANSTVVCDVMFVTPLGGGCSIQMPDATNTSLGEKSVIYNAGSTALTIEDSAGDTIASIPSFGALWFALTNNTTQAGNWLAVAWGGTSGGGGSAPALAGAGLGVSGTTLQQIMTVNTLSVSYVAGASDRDVAFNWVGGAGTFTLPAAASVGNNYYIQIRNSGTGTLTIQPSGTDEINALANITFQIGDSGFLVTDGTGWWTIGWGNSGSSGGGSAFSFIVLNLSGQTGTYVLSGAQLGQTAYRFTGTLTANLAIQVPNNVAQYWVDNETTGAFTLAIGTNAQITGNTAFDITMASRYVLYCDGSNVLNAATSGIGIPLQISQGGTGATVSSAALTNLGGTSIGTAVFTTPDMPTAQAALGISSSSDSQVWGLLF